MVCKQVKIHSCTYIHNMRLSSYWGIAAAKRGRSLLLIVLNSKTDSIICLWQRYMSKCLLSLSRLTFGFQYCGEKTCIRKQAQTWQPQSLWLPEVWENSPLYNLLVNYIVKFWAGVEAPWFDSEETMILLRAVSVDCMGEKSREKSLWRGNHNQDVPAEF